MRSHFSGSIVGAIAAAGVGAVISVCLTPARAQTPEASAIAAASILRTPWGEPDLQGIWTDEFDTPFQRPARFANQEYFTEAQREELDKERSSLLSNNERQERGSEVDVAGAYNGVFLSVKRTAARTSRHCLQYCMGVASKRLHLQRGEVPTRQPETASEMRWS